MQVRPDKRNSGKRKQTMERRHQIRVNSPFREANTRGEAIDIAMENIHKKRKKLNKPLSSLLPGLPFTFLDNTFVDLL